VVDTGLTVIGDDSGAIPVLKGISVDAAADRTTSEDFLRGDGDEVTKGEKTEGCCIPS
jgi:hypothetical protein